MEKNNGKLIAIIALVVAVVALSVGFAAFTDSLNITGSAKAAAQSNPFDDGTNGLNYRANTNACVFTGTETSAISGTYSAGNLSDDSWTGISVPLTAEHSSVTCTATIENKTSYTAYLTSLGANGGVSCSSTGANATTNANNVCATVNVVVQIGTGDANKLTFGNTQPSANTSTTSSIAASGTQDVTVTISYSPSALTDEDVTITLPTITHDYSSANPNAS